MKLIFYGYEEETEWFKKRLACPHGVPCPCTPKNGVVLDEHYDCTKCAFHTDNDGNHTNVTYNPPPSDTSDVRKCLHDYIVTVKQCSDCAFYSDGKCQFNYNCPADFDSEGGKHL